MRPRVVICGSYHRDISGLQRLYRELEATGARILSPLSFNFNPSENIVKSINEADFSADELEKFHLRAIKEADFVWFHAPEGYVGISGAFELGYAHAIVKPVFGYVLPRDEMLQSRITIVNSAFEAIESVSSNA